MIERTTANEIIKKMYEPMLRHQLNNTAFLGNYDAPARKFRRTRFVLRRLSEAWDVLRHGSDNIGGW